MEKIKMNHKFKSILLLEMLLAFPAFILGATNSHPSLKLADENQTPNWCQSGEWNQHSFWIENNLKMRISNCTRDSADDEGSPILSSIDVRQEELSTGKTIWKYQENIKDPAVTIHITSRSFDRFEFEKNGRLGNFFGYYFKKNESKFVTARFVLAINEKLYTIFGKIPNELSDSLLYKVSITPPFPNSTLEFKHRTDSLWNTFVSAICTDRDADLGLPVPPQVWRDLQNNIQSHSDSTKNIFSPAFSFSINGILVAPGGLVDDVLFTKNDISQPVVISETESSYGFLTRCWSHHGNGYEWQSTNQEQNSIDAPYWVSTVSSTTTGASIGKEFIVGQKYSLSKKDTDLVLKQGDLTRTVSIRNSKIVEISITAEKISTAISSSKLGEPNAKWESKKNEAETSFDWKIYKLDKFEIQGMYPANLFVAQPNENKIDELIFKSNSGALLRIKGARQSPGANLKQVYKHEIDLRGNGGEKISYKVMKNDWFIISGVKGSAIYYQKSLLRNNFLKTIELTYGGEQKSIYNPLVKKIVDRFCE